VVENGRISAPAGYHDQGRLHVYSDENFEEKRETEIESEKTSTSTRSTQTSSYSYDYDDSEYDDNTNNDNETTMTSDSSTSREESESSSEESSSPRRSRHHRRHHGRRRRRRTRNYNTSAISATSSDKTSSTATTSGRGRTTSSTADYDVIAGGRGSKLVRIVAVATLKPNGKLCNIVDVEIHPWKPTEDGLVDAGRKSGPSRTGSVASRRLSGGSLVASCNEARGAESSHAGENQQGPETASNLAQNNNNSSNLQSGQKVCISPSEGNLSQRLVPDLEGLLGQGSYLNSSKLLFHPQYT